MSFWMDAHLLSTFCRWQNSHWVACLSLACYGELFTGLTFIYLLLSPSPMLYMLAWFLSHQPLRRLIVLADPHSVTSPDHILDRWKNGMNITRLFENDIFPNGVPPPPSKTKVRTRVGIHRIRQREFVGQCLKILHSEGREWIVLTDTGESFAQRCTFANRTYGSQNSAFVAQQMNTQW